MSMAAGAMRTAIRAGPKCCTGRRPTTLRHASSTYRENRKISIPTESTRMIVRMLRARVPTVLKLEKRNVLTIIKLKNPISTINKPE